MSKKTRKGRQRQDYERAALPSDELLRTQPRTQRSRTPFKPKTEKQRKYASAISANTLIFCEGPMGTGKTYVAVCKAADALMNGDTDKLIITRPAVNADEEYGFLPGDMLDDNGGKFAPYFAPVRAILEERMGAGCVEMFLKNGKIEIAPLGHMRGHTFKDCWVLFDEAQNSTPQQMKLFLTRIGENCKVIVDGDPLEQSDINVRSGMTDAMNLLRDLKGVSFIRFDIDDVVRSGISREILLRYREKQSQQQEGQTVGHENLENILGQSAHG